MVADAGVPVRRKFSGSDGVIYYSDTGLCSVSRIMVGTPDEKIAVMTLLHELAHKDIFIRMSVEQRKGFLSRIFAYRRTCRWDLATSTTVRFIQENEVAAWRKALELKSEYGLDSGNSIKIFVLI